MKTSETQEYLNLENRRDGLMDQFAQMDELTRADRVERNLEVDRQRIIRSDYFANASTECIDLYTYGFFIATVMTTQAVNEGIIKFVAGRNNIHRFSRNSERRFARMNDIIFFYSKGNENTFNFQYTERRKSSVEEKGWDTVVDKGVRKLLIYDMEKVQQAGIDFDRYDKVVTTKKLDPAMGQVWSDIQFLNSQAKERTGYPTQKPVALYKRIVAASSNEGDLVLDPFCGCGTTLMAAEELGRQWIGIDLTYLATGAVKHQIEKFFPQLRDSVIVTGTPEDADTALALARRDPVGFRRVVCHARVEIQIKCQEGRGRWD